MTAEWFAFWERLHGHVGWCAVALLVHPLVLLRSAANLRRAARAATWASIGLGLTVLSGLLLYPSYRGPPKARLLRVDPDTAWWFERKEHLGVFALVCALAAVAWCRQGPGARPQALRWLWLCAVLAVTAAVAGTWVASRAHPGWAN